MSEVGVKVTEKQSSSSMPTHTKTPKSEVPTDLPTEVTVELALAILFTNAKRLEKEALAQILTGHTPKGEVVTYIKLVGVSVDKTKGFVLPTDVPTVANALGVGNE